jgi:hypothetical protein
MPHKQKLLRMHEKAPSESCNVYNKDLVKKRKKIIYVCVNAYIYIYI